MYLPQNCTSNSDVNISEAFFQLSTISDMQNLWLWFPFRSSQHNKNHSGFSNETKHVEEIKAASCRGEARLSVNNPQLGLYFYFYTLS